MKQTRKTIDFTRKNDFIIPVVWRRKLKIEEGMTVMFNVENHRIVIKPAYHKTLDVMSTVGRKGLIYVPKEIRTYFEQKGFKRFQMDIEEGEKAVIMKPLQEEETVLTHLNK
ncbi:AbrB/MazE/SpoVT family DNA-binding domain-containing protein [Halobacillus sp. GSS1]|uniref:AbrB/MazE/SpoVT family DNA-binding domain-containing protein n=1 Tax=Halobacillus sp. GSS1 TaxID=2815919 RepID=UPI001A8F8BCE|nr:AbrB/MazE/SpoVT family DNA-binding domain-containing protein [Halobacillus sp. GSS1]MBN9653299.1 AbrB/MazE/SpoVT family DNA-binding domain-containing protein [Halobacillus sp. GSS1]